MNEKTVVVTRVFEAPRGRVFECWTRAEHLQHWFGPKGFTIHSCETDARPGGIFRLCLRAPDGRDYWVRGEFREVAAPAHLVITCVADNDKGVQQLQEVIDVTFSESQGRTTVTVNAIARGPSDEAAAMLKGMDKGWAQTVDRLAAHLRRK
ncbi:MAG TPA: SRPBCC domain-containing protein [Burkholderiales bacterium]|nr:SRPBCC domain-containing protein [Burkholderiales bacterium]